MRISPFATAGEMLRALRAGEISAVELLELHLSRIERHNPAVNAVVFLDEEGARRAALAADEARRRGEDAPLLGLPLTCKDWLEVGGMRSTAGDPGLADYRAAADGPVIARWRAAGAIIMGSRNWYRKSSAGS